MGSGEGQGKELNKNQKLTMRLLIESAIAPIQTTFTVLLSDSPSVLLPVAHPAASESTCDI